MWTMRWRAPAQPVDNACALPTARAFDHMPTAFDHDQIKKKSAALPMPRMLLNAPPHPRTCRSPNPAQTRR